MEERESANLSPLTIIFLVFLCLFLVVFGICCFIWPKKGKRFAMKMFKHYYQNCCFRLKCNYVNFQPKYGLNESTNIEKFEKIIDRFQEDVPKRRVFMKMLENEAHLERVLQVLNGNIKEFQFSIMPTGSLREGFGKMQPSTSVLAADYDMMLIPEDCFINLSEQLVCSHLQQSIKTDSSIFEAVQPAGTGEAFCWLKLKDKLPPRHQHWKKYTIFKKYKGVDIRVLSNDLVKERLRHSLTAAKYQLETFDVVKDMVLKGEVDHQYSSNVSINGPAVTIKIKKVENVYTDRCFRCCFGCCTAMNNVACCGKCYRMRDVNEINHDVYAFYSDFTLAVCCRQWPNVAEEWITRNRNWPDRLTAQKIVNSVIHVVPKPSSLQPISYVETQPLSAEDNLLQKDSYASLSKNIGTEFRFSFSQAETILADAVPKAAKEVYIVFKSTIKRLQEKIDCYAKIESFALKSILYRTLETMNEGHLKDFPPGCRGNLLMSLFQSLNHALQTQQCDHYWISTHNLFKKFQLEDEENLRNDEIAPTEHLMLQSRNQLLQELQALIRNPTSYILDNWVEHNRFLIDYCCFGSGECSCRCLNPCEVDYEYVGRNNNLFGTYPSAEHRNETFAVY